MSALRKIDIRLLDASELDGVVELFDVVWPSRDGHAERTRWAFDTNPGGRLPLVGAVDVESGAVIGVRGGTRWPLGSGPRWLETDSVQLHGTCVHPAYRRLGLFTEMNREFVRHARATGLALIFNVSVAASRAGYEKLGWHYLRGFRSYHRVERPAIVAATLSKRRPGRAGLRERAESYADPAARPAFHAVREFLDRRSAMLAGLAHTTYTTPFFDWRFSNSGHRFFGSADVGYCVYRMRSINGLRDLLIGDLWPAPGRIAALLTGAARAERADTTTIWLSGSHPLRGSLLRHRFVPDLRRCLNFGVKVLGRRATPLLSPARWGSVSADIDTF